LLLTDSKFDCFGVPYFPISIPQIPALNADFSPPTKTAVRCLSICSRALACQAECLSSNDFSYFRDADFPHFLSPLLPKISSGALRYEIPWLGRHHRKTVPRSVKNSWPMRFFSFLFRWYKARRRRGKRARLIIPLSSACFFVYLRSSSFFFPSPSTIELHFVSVLLQRL